MFLCILSPVTGLTRYSTLSQHHLCLAQIKTPGYWEFYRQRREAGDHIILDNGAYESQLNVPVLLDRIRYLHPQVVVLPDFLSQHWKKTWRASTDFLDQYFYALPKVQWMYVPQSEPGDLIGFVEGYSAAVNDSRISWIGLPRALCYSISNDLSMRVRMAEQIRKRSSKIKIHALGMVKGNVSELKALRETGCVQSIDSNAPVWRGWNNHHLSDEWQEVPVNYADPRVPEPGSLRDQLISDNLSDCGVLTCRHTT